MSYDLFEHKELLLENYEIGDEELLPDNKAEMKKAVDFMVKTMKCPNCGSVRLKIDGLQVWWRKVNLRRYEEVDGFFGKKRVYSLDKTVYQILDYKLRDAGFLDGGGSIKCQNCGYEASARKKMSIQWVSINDIQKAYREFKSTK